MAGHSDISMDDADLLRALEWQADHADNNGAPCTGRIIRAFVPLLESGTRVADRMLNWPGLSLEDAMPLRLTGGLHNLHLTGADNRLGPIYAGEVADQAQVDAIVLAVVQAHDDVLFQWFAGPPQTNEAGRSAGIMAGLLWLSRRIGSRFELLEIGASAGANTMMERYAYDLGGVHCGPAGSPVTIRPEWRGSPPPSSPVEIASIRGCDQAPLDLCDPEQALRLTSYCWPENSDRLARLNGVIALAGQKRPHVDHADAADWVERQLELPQQSGVTRVLYHSIVWQYIPADRRARIEAAMAEAGSCATTERPLAWIMLETNRQTFRHELRTRHWPGGEDWTLLGEAQAHGAWVEWF